MDDQTDENPSVGNDQGSEPTPLMDNDGQMTHAAIEGVQRATLLIGKIRKEVGKSIYGQQEVVDEVLITLLAGGHGLLVGVPGLAKTLLVETLGTILGLDERRVQFTPDLLPADILGSEVLEEDEKGKRHFRFIKGPAFCQLLMGDEINRASPRTQSALLQAMQEHEVTIAGHTHKLPSPFHVLATQNPIEQEGTYPLPEAQLDRFFMQINVDYPDRETEREILIKTTGLAQVKPKQIISADDLKNLQQIVRTMPVGEKVVEAILTLVRNARPNEENKDDDDVLWGPGPRAAQCLMLGIRALALLEGRLAPSIDDVVHLAKPVLRHRMALTFRARSDGLTVDNFVDQLCKDL
jgi:MoxR-like ATPase